MSKIYVIGGSNVDIYAKSYEQLIIKDSNPSTISFSFGGVGKNIAENLASFNLPVSFISAFGKDAYGKEMYQYLKDKKIDLKYSICSKEHNSSVYLAILNRDDMYLGASDMSIIDLLDTNHLSKLKGVIKEDDYVVFDTNLNRDLIGYIVFQLPGIKIAEAISANKVVKLVGLFDKIDILKVNLLEAQTLGNKAIQKYEDAEYALNSFIKQGCKEIILTIKDGMLIANDAGIREFKHNRFQENPVNVSGAGDALLSGYIYGKYQNLPIEETVKIALACGVATTMVNEPVASLNINEIKNFDIEIKEITNR